MGNLWEKWITRTQKATGQQDAVDREEEEEIRVTGTKADYMAECRAEFGNSTSGRKVEPKLRELTSPVAKNRKDFNYSSNFLSDLRTFCELFVKTMKSGNFRGNLFEISIL